MVTNNTGVSLLSLMCHKEPLKKLHYKALVCSHGVGRKVCENESQCTESVFEAEQMLSGSNFPLTRCSFSSKANSIANKKGSLSLRSAPETQPKTIHQWLTVYSLLSSSKLNCGCQWALLRCRNKRRVKPEVS